VRYHTREQQASKQQALASNRIHFNSANPQSVTATLCTCP
jgi:hypothetical protein